MNPRTTGSPPRAHNNGGREEREGKEGEDPVGEAPSLQRKALGTI